VQKVEPKVEPKPVVKDEFSELLDMATTSLTAKPQTQRPQQNNSIYQQEALPNVRPDFTVQMPQRITNQRPRQVPQNIPQVSTQINYGQARPQNPHQMISQSNYTPARPSQQPAQQQGIDDLFGSTQTAKPVSAPPPKAQPAPANSKYKYKCK
jgi:hypothetical protein